MPQGTRKEAPLPPGARRPRRSGRAGLLVLIALGGGCAGARRPAAGGPNVAGGGAPARSAPVAQDELPEGVFHVVRPGQTLWRIARAYGVPVGTLARANAIADPTRLAAGRAVFVPGASAPIEFAPYPAPVPSPETPAAGPRTTPSAFSWPVESGQLLSCFGAPRGGRRHSGVDIRGRRGEPVLAARDGIVVLSGTSGNGYGTVVVIDHEDGFQTVYAHNDRELVEAGRRVRAGEPIALVGRTGNATTDHVHFEIRRGGAPVDPLPYLGQASCP